MLQLGTLFYAAGKLCYKVMLDREFWWERKWNSYTHFYSISTKQLLSPSEYVEPVEAALWLLLEYVYGADDIKYSPNNQVLKDNYSISIFSSPHHKAVLEALRKNLPLSSDEQPKHKPLLNKILADLNQALIKCDETPKEGSKLACILKVINNHYKTLPIEFEERFRTLMDYTIPSDRKTKIPNSKPLAQVYLYLCAWGFTTIRLTQVFQPIDKAAFITKNSDNILNWTEAGLLIRDCYAELLSVDPQQVDLYIDEIQKGLFGRYKLNESDFTEDTQDRTIDYQYNAHDNSINIRFRAGDYQSGIYTMDSNNLQNPVPGYAYMYKSYDDVYCFLKEKDTHFADFINKLSSQPSQVARLAL